jgi:N-acetylglucosaminyldiphosphoundecaprenol N-acetyl-beta-D-mannosaminyltransferase
VHLGNAYTVVLAASDETFDDSLRGGGLVFPDGKPLGWVSALRRDRPRLQQVRGPQLFLDALDRGRSVGVKHYLLGGSPKVLADLEHELRERFDGLEIVGAFSPPFRPPSTDELAARDRAIRESGAHIVWVGLGTPKQDHEAKRLARSVGVIAVAVGAAFDFAAGAVPEAPQWMRAIGLEWLFRLLTEPRRLWRRYLVGNAQFLRIAFNSVREPRTDQ